MYVLFLVLLSIVIIFGLIWVCGIDTMKNKYPNYKGEDFLELPGKNPFL